MTLRCKVNEEDVRLAKRVGMIEISAVYKGQLIGTCHNIYGKCIVNPRRGILAQHLPSTAAAMRYFDKHYETK